MRRGAVAYVGCAVVVGALSSGASGQCEPEIVGLVDTPSSAQDVAVAGTVLYVDDRGSYFDGYVAPPLQVIDVSDPMNPVIVGSYEMCDHCYSTCVAVDGTVLYLGAEDSWSQEVDVFWLSIIDVSDPTNPVGIAGAAFDNHPVCDVALSGTWAYVACADGGLWVIDVLDPTNPGIQGHVHTPGYAYGVAVSGTVAYVADDESGVQVIDVSDPTAPVIIGSVDTQHWVLAVAVSGTVAYVAHASFGLQLIDARSCIWSCPDLTSDGTVAVDDLLIVLGGWGTDAGDVTGDGMTDVADLLAILSAWGPCD